MFTPVALPIPLPGQPKQLPLHLGSNPAPSARNSGGGERPEKPKRARLETNSELKTQEDSKLAAAATASVFATGEASKVLDTTSFLAVKQQLYALRAYRRQEDAAAADMGLGGAADRDDTKKDHTTIQSSLGGQKKHRKHHPHRSTKAKLSPVPSERFGVERIIEEENWDDGDLALPPPALPLDSDEKVRYNSLCSSSVWIEIWTAR